MECTKRAREHCSDGTRRQQQTTAAIERWRRAQRHSTSLEVGALNVTARRTPAAKLPSADGAGEITAAAVDAVAAADPAVVTTGTASIVAAPQGATGESANSGRGLSSLSEAMNSDTASEIGFAEAEAGRFVVRMDDEAELLRRRREEVSSRLPRLVARLLRLVWLVRLIALLLRLLAGPSTSSLALCAVTGITALCTAAACCKPIKKAVVEIDIYLGYKLCQSLARKGNQNQGAGRSQARRRYVDGGE